MFVFFVKCVHFGDGTRPCCGIFAVMIGRLAHGSPLLLLLSPSAKNISPLTNTDTASVNERERVCEREGERGCVCVLPVNDIDEIDKCKDEHFLSSRLKEKKKGPVHLTVHI